VTTARLSYTLNRRLDDRLDGKEAGTDRNTTIFCKLPNPAMSKLEELAERVERLVLRHDELKRTNALLQQQLATLTGERDNLRSRLGAARSRIDALLERLPTSKVEDKP